MKKNQVTRYSLLIPAALMAASLAMSTNSLVAFADESSAVDNHTVVQPKLGGDNDTADTAKQQLSDSAEMMADKPITKASEAANPVAADKLPLDTNQSAEDIIAVKKAYIAQNTGLPLDKIQLLDTSEGKALMYPHGDHHHVILLDKIDVSKPFDDGHSSHHSDHAHHHHDDAIEGSFAFTATVIDPEGKVLSGKDVQVVDITSGRKTLATVTTDEKGQAVFDKLPLGRSLSISVNGVPQGYTVRRGVDGDKHSASFTVDGKGTVEPEYSKTPLVVVVRNEDAEPLSGQEVTLKHRVGRVIEKVTTGADGKAVFSKGLLDGTFYEIFVNGKKLSQATTGEERSVALDAKDIKKSSPHSKPQEDAPKVPETKPETKPEAKPLSPEKADQAGKVAAPAHTASKAAAAKAEMKKTTNQLPATGEAVNPFFTTAALAVMATAGVVAIKRKEN
ncbi:TPA: LPXTG cell wall anchor domain-containing protein [Streptococcus equi subsp. zooepidemicus]|uniref:Cell surface-anchored protein n=1 Tax=Streptococcus equi subsp. ruminatorum CECT 5772 TaxID=1051981 RepID=A0A922T7G9_9STRE|nr:LPXTG cell wall anchor domain-containing protein [Streptococcus equi]KED04826.1 cell surface-anchored protein [Streptococcus equi subsp. ruminatorum CECT 5772]HEL0247286.1 LPXTG cell wall anchor domain-containing protein [Streptococcus equi subsp. zooepidemicus]HEL1011141.1 LPXTG cell wall anchor domain-containing protein [Streptococcus equi subsp. ruminatorum]HEL1024338.1 LPXTG cell wall anchor domain-containing protein [Streptococcus equi subsp. ruminatorum CECT 5772]